jgi:two-component system, NtrC family, sensor kinase
MRRHSRAGGKSPNAQAPKAAARKSRVAPKARHPHRTLTANLEAEVARLTRERDEAFKQQTATAEVLKTISRSTFDLQAVLETLLQSAAQLCVAEKGGVWQRDGEFLRATATFGLTPEVHQYAIEYPMQLGRGSATGRAALEGKAVHIVDVLADPDYVATDFSEVVGYRTLLSVPLLRGGAMIGVFSVGRTEVNPFTNKQIELVTTFADQAVIAIENARLVNELRESLQQQTATADVLKIISRATFDLPKVLNTLLVSAARLCEADKGAIFRPTGNDSNYYVATSYRQTTEYDEYQKNMTFAPGRGGVVGRVLLEGKSVQIPDILVDPEYTYRDIARVGDYRTIVGVPLLREGVPIGVFALQRTAVRPFAEAHIKLVETFADQAVIAIENTRLFEAEQQRTRELTESLEQQTATSEVLQVISSSPSDLEPVFASMLENAVRICNATFGNIYRWDGEALHLLAAHNTPPAFAEARKRSPLYPGPNSPAGRMVATKAVVHVADRAAERAYIEQRDPATVAAVELGGVRTVLYVPMLKDNDLIGVFTVFRQEVRPFTDKQIALVKNFAAQAVIAIENARLLNELRQRTTDLTERTTDLTEALERQTATSDVLRVISASPGDLEPVFQIMLENATRVCQAKFGIMFLYDGEGFRTAALHGVSPAYAEARRKKIFVVRDLHPNVPVARVARTNEVVHIVDATLEQGYVERDPLWIEFVDLGGGRSLLAVPMLKENELIGAFTLYRQEVCPFTDKQIELVQNFASQAVIAIENTRLLTELRHRTDDLGRSVSELSALGEVSQAVNSTLDLETVLSTIVANAVQLSGTEAGAIYVFDDLPREFHLRATYGMDQGLIEALTQRRIGLDDPNIAQALARLEPIQIADLREEASNEINEITLRAGYLARLVAPLRRGEDVVGFLVVRRRAPGAFPQNTVDLIKTFAAQSAVAIENARLFKNVETSLEDLRTTQDRLVQTQKLASLGQLTAGIAHEIKNPLNFVNNFSGVSAELLDELQEALGKVNADATTLAEITELSNTLRDNLSKIAQHGKRADSIVKNMLLHSREGSGEHRLVDANALVEEAVNLAYHGARAEKQGFNVTLERSLDPAAGEVDCFPQEITRVLLNLISNGFYAATRRKGQTKDDNFEPKLAAATRSLGDRVEIRIRDNGTGIAPEVKEKLFSPFFTTKPAGEGTGLGLSISHDIIVKQHAGSIEIDSQPGEYTEVRIVLPRAGAALIKSGERI